MRDHEGLCFSLSEYARRLTELRARLRDAGLDAAVIIDPENLFYLTGFQTTGYTFLQALFVPSEGEPVSLCRLLEESNFITRTWVEHTRTFRDGEDPVEGFLRVLDELGLSDRRVGIERGSYFFPAYLQDRFSQSPVTAALLDCTGIVEASRVRKSDAELALMREAARVGLAGMAAGLAEIASGKTENDLAAAVHESMFRAGGEYPAVAPYITSGPRTCIGHATWEGRRLERGDCVFLEIAGCVKRYHAAMMRTAVIGEPSPDMRAAEEVVLAALDAMMSAARAGEPVSRVDQAARRELARYRGSGGSVSRTGYGMGIAFAPTWDEGYIVSVGPEERTVLQPNMTFHFIPWMLGIDGCRVMAISETVVVGESGAAPLVDFDRRLRVIETGGGR